MTREADALLARSSCDNIWESVAHSPQLSHLIFDWASIQELNYADPVYTQCIPTTCCVREPSQQTQTISSVFLILTRYFIPNDGGIKA